MGTGKNNRVLFIDDDESLVGIMAIRLKRAGYQVDTAIQGAEGYNLASKQPYDVLILDVAMPGVNGFDVCKDLRAQGVLTPILMLSGKTEKVNIVRSLELGADDYLTKPFSHNELIARLRALVRRNKKSFSSRWVNKNGLELDVINSSVRFGNQSAALTKKEALLLRRLMYEAPQSVGREILLKDVWNIDDMHTSNRLDVYIRRLRWKLDKIGGHNLIHTLRGSGYLFGPAEEEV